MACYCPTAAANETTIRNAIFISFIYSSTYLLDILTWLILSTPWSHKWDGISYYGKAFLMKLI